MEHRQYTLGIHGDNRKTDVILVTMEGTLITQETGDPSDLEAVGCNRAAEIILGLAIKCCQKVGCRPSDLYAVAVGLTGADRPSERMEFQNQLHFLSRKEKFPLSSTIVETSVRISLEAAFASNSGILLMAGAKSIACAKAEDGKVYHAGGGGKVLGGEGGAHALARDALNAAVRSYDGRGARTLLLERALQRFGVTTAQELLIKADRNEVDVASFFPEVLEANEAGDHIAHGILFRGAGELASLVHALTMKIQPKRKLPVSLMGELLEEENAYSRMVRERILSSLPQLVVQKPKFPQVFGGVILALRPFEFKR